MKKYNITVNGKTYEVFVEESTGAVSVPQISTPVAAAPVAATPAPAPKPTVVAGANSVTAPLPGNVLRINVKQGDAVKSGDVLLILEAMKMENEIVAPSDGTVASIAVSQGAAVNTGDVLLNLN